MESDLVLGVDIGGSHITAKLVDLRIGGAVKETEVREPVNAKGAAEEIISVWCGVILRALAKSPSKVQKIGIAMPAPFDYERGIAWMQNQEKYDALYGLNVRERLAAKLSLPLYGIRFINDAESFLKGEAFNGAARQVSRAVGITLGTGLGSAKCINGAFEDANLWCSSFLGGIAEDYLSTRWFVGRYAELSGKQVLGVKELACLNDESSGQVFKEFGKNLAVFLSGKAITKADPEVVVLGGNISKAYNRFENSLMDHLNQLKKAPSIRKAALGEDAALVGAASCWQKTEFMDRIRF